MPVMSALFAGKFTGNTSAYDANIHLCDEVNNKIDSHVDDGKQRRLA